jgi:hypothetical protein
MKTDKQKTSLRNPIEITEAIEKRSFIIFRLIGYVLIILSVFDYLAIFFPPQLTNPGWELQVVSLMVDHVWAVILGIAFVFFYGRTSLIGSKQISILKFLSWMALVLGVVYILVVPLSINNSLTLYRNINTQFDVQKTQREEQVQKLTSNLNALKSPDELRRLAAALKVEKMDQLSPEDLKDKISERIRNTAENASATAKYGRVQELRNLIKESLRINMGAIVSGVCLIFLWNLTRWVRAYKE